jgi:hypothetical protein
MTPRSLSVVWRVTLPSTAPFLTLSEALTTTVYETPSWVGTTSVMKPGTLTSALVTLTGVPGLLFVTTMLRVMGSLPAVKLPKLTVIGETETRGRTMPETGISRLGCC